MSKPVTITLDQDAFDTFKAATNLVNQAGIRVPTSQLVETLVNAELSRLSSRKIAQRFLKSIVQQVSGIRSPLAGEEEEEDDEELPKFPPLPTPPEKP